MKKKNIKKNKKTILGLSMVELLIVLVIITVLFTLGVGSYRNYAQKQQVVAAGRAVESALRLTKQLAFSGTKPTGCTGVLDGYYFIVEPDGIHYSIEASCTNLDEPIEVGRSNVEVPYGLSIDISDADGMILFKSIGQGTDVKDPTTITLDQSETGYTATFNITDAVGTDPNPEDGESESYSVESMVVAEGATPPPDLEAAMVVSDPSPTPVYTQPPENFVIITPTFNF